MQALKKMIGKWMAPAEQEGQHGLYDEANKVVYHSAFGGLWIDRKDAPQRVDKMLAQKKITPAQAEQLTSFIENGFLIIPNAVPHAVIDQLNADLDKSWNEMDPRYLVQTAHGSYVPLPEVERTRVLAKVLDVYVHSDAAVKASFSQPIVDFLKIVFEGEVQGFQNLTFEVGSTQAVHKDGSYVVVNKPMHFAASWVAREDIKEGSGELVYYPGSHRFPDYVFAEKYMHWNPERDGVDVHKRQLQWLHEQAKERGIELQTFRPKKGDALIWHAGLAHGGGPITDTNLTRKSYVTHYCPHGVRPNYYAYLPDKAKSRPVGNGCHISSNYYDV